MFSSGSKPAKKAAKILKLKLKKEQFMHTLHPAFICSLWALP